MNSNTEYMMAKKVADETIYEFLYMCMWYELSIQDVIRFGRRNDVMAFCRKYVNE